jgi:methyl-accepting chemotaxis protein-1 (serine sensor receptor)
MSFHNNIKIKTLLRGAMAIFSPLLALVGAAGRYGMLHSNDALLQTDGNQLASSQALSETMLGTTGMRLALDRGVMPVSALAIAKSCPTCSAAWRPAATTGARSESW